MRVEEGRRERDAARSGAQVGDRAAIPAGVDGLDAKPVSSSDFDASSALSRRKNGQQLHDLAIEFYGDETVTGGVEPGHGTRFVLHAAFERQCGYGLEARQKTPERRDQEPLERNSTKGGGNGEPWLIEQRTQ